MMSRSLTGDTELMYAVRRGDLEEAERLAMRGDGLDGTDASGQTALHVAARQGRADIAGCLLAHGADYDVADAAGHTALSLDHIDIELLHAVRQHYQRYRDPSVRPSNSDDPSVSRYVEALDTNGIVRLDGVVGAPLLAQLQADFAAFADEIEKRVKSGSADYGHYDQEAYYWPADRAYITNNAFKYSAALARLCCSKPVADVVRLYLGKAGFIQRALAMRYLPCESKSHDMFRYHHDLVDRRLKLMVLLTDVGEGDQDMSYVMGSQTLFHPYEMFQSNVCPLEYCEWRLGRLEIFRTLGAAGDVFLFDSNGAHMGNRRPTGRTRDAFFVEFSAARTPQFGGDIPPEVFDTNPLTASHPLYVMAHSPKRWEQPITRGSRPTWIVDLPQPSTWVWRARRVQGGCSHVLQPTAAERATR
jgi:ectoine hydroxylase-related dioxygenase (phytanoyl-CoA dioxygenase family)